MSLTINTERMQDSGSLPVQGSTPRRWENRTVVLARENGDFQAGDVSNNVLGGWSKLDQCCCAHLALFTLGLTVVGAITANVLYLTGTVSLLTGMAITFGPPLAIMLAVAACCSSLMIKGS